MKELRDFLDNIGLLILFYVENKKVTQPLDKTQLQQMYQSCAEKSTGQAAFGTPTAKNEISFLYDAFRKLIQKKQTEKSPISRIEFLEYCLSIITEVRSILDEPGFHPDSPKREAIKTLLEQFLTLSANITNSPSSQSFSIIYTPYAPNTNSLSKVEEKTLCINGLASDWNSSLKNLLLELILKPLQTDPSLKNFIEYLIPETSINSHLDLDDPLEAKNDKEPRRKAQASEENSEFLVINVLPDQNQEHLIEEISKLTKRAEEAERKLHTLTTQLEENRTSTTKASEQFQQEISSLKASLAESRERHQKIEGMLTQFFSLTKRPERLAVMNELRRLLPNPIPPEKDSSATKPAVREVIEEKNDRTNKVQDAVAQEVSAKGVNLMASAPALPSAGHFRQQIRGDARGKSSSAPAPSPRAS